MSNNNIISRDNVIKWNIQYPFDYIWRKKYNIPFGSKQHLEHCHIDMMFDLYEDKVMQGIMKNSSSEHFTEEDVNLLEDAGLEQSKKIIKMNESEVNQEFENLDVEQFNEQ